MNNTMLSLSVASVLGVIGWVIYEYVMAAYEFWRETTDSSPGGNDVRSGEPENGDFCGEGRRNAAPSDAGRVIGRPLSCLNDCARTWE